MLSTASFSPALGRLPNPRRSRKSDRSRAGARDAATTRCSRTVISPKSSRRWNVRASPRRVRRCGLARVTSTPASVTCPDRGRRRPDRIPKSVVLPAPFGPTSPVIARLVGREVDRVECHDAPELHGHSSRVEQR